MLITGKGSVSRIVIFAVIFFPKVTSNIIDRPAMQVQVSSIKGQRAHLRFFRLFAMNKYWVKFGRGGGGIS